MNINHHNYEEFFILYMDNELSAEDRRSVELFVQENADLKEELDILLQSRMVPDEKLVFEEKDSLLKSGGLSSIGAHNYEEWFLYYADNELTPAQRKEVEQFITNHSSLQNELTLLLRAKIEPEEIVFPYKESLYREEEKVRVIAFSWKRYAAAAALLLAVSTTALVVYRNNNKTDTTGVAVTTPAKINPVTTPTIKQTQEKEASPATDQQLIKDDAPVIAQTTPAPVKSVSKKPIQDNQKDNKKNAVEVLPVIKEEKTEQLAIIKQNNNLPEPRYNPNVREDREKKDLIANNTDKSSSLTGSQQNIVDQPVTTNTTPTLIQASNTDEGVAVNEPNGNKNKLRGFFRKLTRTFEKNTNIKATDEQDRLLVGGLAIRL